MCLRAYVSNSDITTEQEVSCYKVLCYDKSDKSLTTPCKNFPVKLKDDCGNLVAEGFSDIYYDEYKTLNIVGKGFIHCVLEKDDAIKLATSYDDFVKIYYKNFDKFFRVYRCVVPPQPSVYFGKCDEGYACVAAKYIEIKERIR